MKQSIRGFSRFFAGSVFLVVGLLFGPLRPYVAHAMWGNCEDDPKIWLSNGTEVDLTASISVPASAISSVSYVLHVAPGLTVKHVVDTGHKPYAENLVVRNDAAVGHATSETTVILLSPGGAAVQATTSINEGASGPTSGTDGQDLIISGSTSGTDGQDLIITL